MSTTSMFIFTKDNSLRLWLKGIINNKYFDGFILNCIAFNSLLLALDVPNLYDPYQKDSIALMLNIISVIFVVECFAKFIVMGVYWGENTYFKDRWNTFDFLIVISSLLTWTLEVISSNDISFVRAFRALRALRPLRLANRNEGLRTVFSALMKSVPSLLNVMLIILLFLLVFGILGVQLFKGMFGICNDTSPLILTKSDCVGSFNITNYNEFG